MMTIEKGTGWYGLAQVTIVVLLAFCTVQANQNTGDEWSPSATEEASNLDKRFHINFMRPSRNYINYMRPLPWKAYWKQIKETAQRNKQSMEQFHQTGSDGQPTGSGGKPSGSDADFDPDAADGNEIRHIYDDISEPGYGKKEDDAELGDDISFHGNAEPRMNQLSSSFFATLGRKRRAAFGRNYGNDERADSVDERIELVDKIKRKVASRIVSRSNLSQDGT